MQKGTKIDMEKLHKTKANNFRYNEMVVKLPVQHNKPFEISHYGITYTDPNYHQIRLSSQLTAVEYVLSGSGTVNINGKSYNVNKGDTYILVQGKDQNYYSSPNNPLQKIWFNCTGPLVTELLKQYNLDDSVIFRNLYTYHHIERVHKIMSESTNTDDSIDKSCLIFHEILQILHKNKIDHESLEDPANAIRHYIDCHISENIKISEISDILSYTNDHIIRLFKSKYGITPHQYIINSKMQIAAVLLRSTNKSISEISDELNYTEVHHFSALFEKTTGLRPSAYRKQHRAINHNHV